MSSTVVLFSSPFLPLVRSPHRAACASLSSSFWWLSSTWSARNSTSGRVRRAPRIRESAESLVSGSTHPPRRLVGDAAGAARRAARGRDVISGAHAPGGAPRLLRGRRDGLWAGLRRLAARQRVRRRAAVLRIRVSTCARAAARPARSRPADAQCLLTPSSAPLAEDQGPPHSRTSSRPSRGPRPAPPPTPRATSGKSALLSWAAALSLPLPVPPPVAAAAAARVSARLPSDASARSGCRQRLARAPAEMGLPKPLQTRIS